MSSMHDITDRAERLVPTANINATTMFVPLLDRFPLLCGVDVDRWDFVVTIAGVFVAITRLRGLNIEEVVEEGAEKIVITHLVNWDNRACDAFADCLAFFEETCEKLQESGVERRWIASNALGYWIIRNVLDTSPSPADATQIIRVLGGMVIHAFQDWWIERN